MGRELPLSRRFCPVHGSAPVRLALATAGFCSISLRLGQLRVQTRLFLGVRAPNAPLHESSWAKGPAARGLLGPTVARMGPSWLICGHFWPVLGPDWPRIAQGEPESGGLVAGEPSLGTSGPNVDPIWTTMGPKGAQPIEIGWNRPRPAHIGGDQPGPPRSGPPPRRPPVSVALASVLSRCRPPWARAASALLPPP